VMFFDRIKIDGPVGAISVHLSCGIWGTLAVGIFSTNPEHSFVTQLVGVLAYGAFTFTAAMLIFAAATQGYWLVRSRLWESLAILLVAFTLFRPGFWWDMVYPPIEQLPATAIVEQAARVPPDSQLQMQVQGETLDGKFVQKTVLLPLGRPGDGETRLRDAGLELRTEDGKVLADNIVWDSAAQKIGLDFDWEIVSLQVQADRPPKHLMFIPALLSLAGIAWLQLRRRDNQTPSPQAA